AVRRLGSFECPHDAVSGARVDATVPFPAGAEIWAADDLGPAGVTQALLVGSAGRDDEPVSYAGVSVGLPAHVVHLAPSTACERLTAAFDLADTVRHVAP
ncbi:hypothetical protein ABE10_02790, partial [Bacillus toyonensis]|nr:hypothetical protein [Bacillus toyonensis]